MTESVTAASFYTTYDDRFFVPIMVVCSDSGIRRQREHSLYPSLLI